ncbi:MAG: hypothetical protein R6X19_03745 [Kiritimatiellia bacterium]
MRLLLALMAFWAFGMGTGLAQDVPSAAAPVRNREAVSSELKAVEEKIGSLTREEAKVLADLKAQSLISTNLVELAGNDLELAGKMKRVQELQAELRKLQKEIHEKMKSSPVIRQRQERLGMPREQMMQIQKSKREWEGRRRALAMELKQLEKPEATSAK